MNQTTNYRWQQEFGAEYAVPSELCDNPEFEDLSWHNDLCPSFCLRGAEGDENLLRIWVNHIDVAERESVEHPRFLVLRDSDYDNAAAFECDDVAEAIKNLKERSN